jgi:hypothetical protein
LEARLTLFCKKIVVAKSKEVKTGLSERQIWQNLLKKLKKGYFAGDDDESIYKNRQNNRMPS